MGTDQKIMMWFVLAVCAFGQTASVEQRTREVLDLWVAGRYGEIHSQFDSKMKELTVATFRQQSEQLKALGPMSRAGEPVVLSSGGFRTVLMRLEFPSTVLQFSVSWSERGEIAGLWFKPDAWNAPSYSNADAFTSVEVTIGTDKWKLPGTLTIPKSTGPFPAVVLVHGSGPNDRDESIGGSKIFKDLAHGLASRGIAVLRYAKRTKVYPKDWAKDASPTMTTETVEDALRAAALLRRYEGIDASRVFVLGHSQGGYMMPRVMQRDSKLAGVIVMAGNVRPLEELIVEQMAYLGVPAQKDVLGSLHLPPQYLADLSGYRPDAEAKKVDMPMLILQGERDYQVTMKDFALWHAALGERANVVFHSYPNLNHLFIAGEGKSLPAEYARPGHLDRQVVEDIADWVRARGI